MRHYRIFVVLGIVVFLLAVFSVAQTTRSSESYSSYLPAIFNYSDGSTPPEVIALPSQPVWRALLLIYQKTDADYIDENGIQQHLTVSMPENEMQMAIWSFRQAASIANDFSEKAAIIKYDIVYVPLPITSLTLIGQLPTMRGDSIQFKDGRPVFGSVNSTTAPSSHSYWPSPNDTGDELDVYAPSGKYDSVFIHWAQCDFGSYQCIPSLGWGYGMQASDWSNGATYATVANGQDWWWQYPTIGEIWLHEWLHGVSPFYQSLGFPQPVGDADGGSSHGYEQSPTTGWSSYYRDLMTARVWEPELEMYTGIPSQAWGKRTILSDGDNVLVDYYYEDTTSTYQQAGTVIWNERDQNIQLGNEGIENNWLNKNAPFNTSVSVSGRVYIPNTGIGQSDSVGIALRGSGVDYWASLTYGTSLANRINLSILRNDEWGDLYPITSSPGWYTIKVLVNYDDSTLRMKAWPDGVNEPEWQTSRPLDSYWTGQGIGFRHFGQGTFVDELMAIQTDGE